MLNEDYCTRKWKFVSGCECSLEFWRRGIQEFRLESAQRRVSEVRSWNKSSRESRLNIYKALPTDNPEVKIRNRVVAIVLLPLCIAGSCFGLVRAKSHWDEYRWLSRSGLKAVAKVTKSDVAKSRLEYRFEVDGKSYSGKGRLRTSYSNEEVMACSVDVMYVPQSPDQNLLVDPFESKNRVDITMALALLTGACVSLLFVSIFSLADRMQARRKRLINRYENENLEPGVSNADLAKPIVSLTDIELDRAREIINRENSKIAWKMVYILGFLMAFLNLFSIVINSPNHHFSFVSDSFDSVHLLTMAIFIFMHLTFLIKPFMESLTRFKLDKELAKSGLNNVNDKRLLPDIFSALGCTRGSIAGLTYNDRILLRLLAPHFSNPTEDFALRFNGVSLTSIHFIIHKCQNLPEMKTLVAAALRALPFFGDSDSFRCVEAISERSKLADVREVAKEVLPALKERVAQLKEKRNLGLLKPAFAPEADHSGLLRPLTTSQRIPENELLRFAEKSANPVLSHESVSESELQERIRLTTRNESEPETNVQKLGG